MSRRVRKITPRLLKRMIFEEAANLKETLEQGEESSEEVEAEETEAEDLAGSLEKDIDYIQALDIHESILKRKLQKVRNARTVLKRRVAKRI